MGARHVVIRRGGEGSRYVGSCALLNQGWVSETDCRLDKIHINSDGDVPHGTDLASKVSSRQPDQHQVHRGTQQEASSRGSSSPASSACPCCPAVGHHPSQLLGEPSHIKSGRVPLLEGSKTLGRRGC